MFEKEGKFTDKRLSVNSIPIVCYIRISIAIILLSMSPMKHTLYI